MIDDRAALLRLAREGIETSFSGRGIAIPPAPWLQVPTAVFVTLRRTDGELRGCVGSIEPRLPLGEAVVAAARSAAFHDGRFAPLSVVELQRVRLEVSVLSALVPSPVLDEVDACRQLEARRPGVVFRCGHRQSVLLPKVWASIRDADDFLRHLKLKAGLSSTFWSKAIELYVFTTDDFAEVDEQPADAEAL